jgi:hypothetical protein
MDDEEFIALNKRTIVRSYTGPHVPTPVRLAGRVLSATAPAIAARLAARWFMTPPRHPAPAPERAALAGAGRASVTTAEGEVPTWTWGSGPPVLLVHGWGGRGGQLAAFAAPLVARGLSAVTFDGPGHGAGPAARQVSIPRLTSALRAVASAHGPLRGIVGHSVGAVVAVRALYEGLDAEAVVLVAPPAEMATPADLFSEALGLSRRVRAGLQAEVERRVGRPWSDFDLTALVPALDVPILVVHDRADGEVPWPHGRTVAGASPRARLLTTDGLGHRRILRHPTVVEEAAAFIAARSLAGPATAVGVDPSVALAAPA